MSTNRFKFNPEDDLAPLLHFLIVLSGIIVGIYFIISAVITAHSPNFTNDNYQIIEHSEEPLLQNETQNEIKTRILVFGYDRLTDIEKKRFFYDIVERNCA